jgi:complement component 1 Q subcomponent-binding protein
VRTSGVVLQVVKPLTTLTTLTASISPRLIPNTQIRSFSSDPSNADSNLSQILTEEILEETSRKDEEADEDYDDVKKYITSMFQLSEKVGYGEVILTRTYMDEEDITIKFDCQDEADDNEGGENLDDLENGAQHHEVTEDDADQLDGKFGIHFEVSIAKKNGDKAVFSCIATHQQPTIVHVNFVPASANEGDSSLYGGPRYEDLDPAVQGGFQQYLAERGIDEDLSFFVIQHSRYKEEAEYLNWLKTLNEFVN